MELRELIKSKLQTELCFGNSEPESFFKLLKLTSAQLDSLTEYFELLMRWTKRVDLVAPAEAAELLDRHLLDSLAALLAIENSHSPTPNFRVLDIGSGAGLPGLIWAITRPEWKLLLCEPRQKRVDFLKEVRRSLNVANVEIFKERMEDLDLESPVQLMTCRALGLDADFFRVSRSLLSHAGMAVVLAGPSLDVEKLQTEIGGGISLQSFSYSYAEPVVRRQLVFHVKH